MKALTIRQTRQALAQLEALLEAEGELTITRRGRPIARVTQVDRKRPVASHRELREKMKPMNVGSEELVRKERDVR